MAVSSFHQPEAAAVVSRCGQAYFRLRELIVTLELPPGSPIHERELMERLELGRTPVREALQALARDGLVDVFPRRGMLVAAVDAGDLSDLHEVRTVLEPVAARAAALRATDAERDTIDDLLVELARAADRHDDRALIELDQQIHRHVYRCAHNPFLERTLNEHYVLALRIWFLALDRVAHLADAVAQHRTILEAVRDGRGDEAADVLRAHIDAFERAIRAVL